MDNILKRKGFTVSAKSLTHSTLTGEALREERLTGYSREKNVKITYSEFSDGRKRLSIVIHGSGATREREEKIMSLGGKVDLNEGERLYAVFNVKNRKHAEEIVNEIFKDNA